MHDPMQKIRERAHAIWEQEGRPDGRELEHWERAERELDGEEGLGSLDSTSSNQAVSDVPSASDLTPTGTAPAPTTGEDTISPSAAIQS